MNDDKLSKTLQDIGVKPGSKKKIQSALNTHRNALTEKKSDEKDFTELSSFLDELKVKDQVKDKYLQIFIGANYNLVDLLNMSTKDLESNLKSLKDIKQGTIVKIQNAIAKKNEERVKEVYGGQIETSRNHKIKKIENSPMGDHWEPGKLDLDLSEKLKKKDGTYSIATACTKLVGADSRLMSLLTSKDHKKGRETQFYMFSTSKNKYFQITINWDN